MCRVSWRREKGHVLCRVIERGGACSNRSLGDGRIYPVPVMSFPPFSPLVQLYSRAVEQTAKSAGAGPWCCRATRSRTQACNSHGHFTRLGCRWIRGGADGSVKA